MAQELGEAEVLFASSDRGGKRVGLPVAPAAVAAPSAEPVVLAGTPGVGISERIGQAS